MMKINLTNGKSEINNIYDDQILLKIKEFWGNRNIPDFQPIILRSFKWPQNSKDKYIFLKIRDIKKITTGLGKLPSNIAYWFSGGNLTDFIKNDIVNATLQSDGSVIYKDLQTSSEVFGLHIADYNAMKKKLKEQLIAEGKIFNARSLKLNANLFKDSDNNSSVFFFLTHQAIESTIQNGKIIWNKPGSSGVKVPKGGAQ